MTPVFANIDLISLVLGSLVFTCVGLAIGYLLGARFKQKYLAVARELACMRGENFQNVPTMGIPRAKTPTAASPATAAPGASDAELAKARREAESFRREYETLLKRMSELEASANQANHLAPLAAEATPVDDHQLIDLQRQLEDKQQELDAQQTRIAELEQALARESELLAEAREIAAELAAESPAVVMAEEESSAPLLEDVEYSELREQLETLEREATALRSRVQQLEQVNRQTADELAQSRAREGQLQNELSTAKSASAAVTTGTESWQIAQLHREHIGLQLQIDGHLEKIRQLTTERDTSRSHTEQSRQQVEQLRLLLAQQEATIASLERERDALRTRADLLEQKG